MCGFAGYLSRSPVSQELLDEVAETIRHRGPDASGRLQGNMNDTEVFGFCFTRLSIQDLDPRSNQPFVKGGIVLIFNGEIYNVDILRRSLAARGVEFRTTSDTEVVLESYRLWGQDFVSRLRGMFAIVLIDTQNQIAVLCRDRFGIKPLYYRQTSEGIYLGSEIQSIMTLSGRSPMNLNYLQIHTLIDPFVAFSCQTPFSDIFLLEPGTLAVVKDSRIVKSLEYYRFRNIEDGGSVPSPSEVQALFTNALSEHLIGDVELGCTLSGGFDSSLISVLARRINSSCRHFFTVDVVEGQSNFSEDRVFADRLYANQLRAADTTYLPLRLESVCSLQIVDDIVRTLGTPLYDARVFVWNAMYQAVRSNNLKVILNGQGADELWYGYYPQIWSWFSMLYHEPLSAKSIRQYFLKTIGQSAAFSKLSAGTMQQIPFFIDHFVGAILANPQYSDHKRITLFMIESVLPSLLKFEDGISMLNSVEVRVPFLDHRLVELALSLDSAVILGEQKMGKDFLKNVFVEVLPIEILNRKKSPLPKPKGGISGIREIFLENIQEISNCSLIQELYEPVKLLELLETSDNASFYGNVGELLLQIVSTWRFAELFA